MIEKRAMDRYVNQHFPGSRILEFETLGSGVHGTGFSLKIETGDGVYDYVIKALVPEGLGHDFPADRAAVFLLAASEYGNLPNHVRAVDVIAHMRDGSFKSLGGGEEYYLIMERAGGTSYFSDLAEFGKKTTLASGDIRKIEALTGYLAEIHAVKRAGRTLYWRKIRDTVGHGECLMGVFDAYPPGTLSPFDMAEIEKKCIDWRMRLKPLYHRLSLVHGDFHPGNIRFHDDTFTILDRSRGPYGEPADDVTALTINYLFFSLRATGELRGPYLEAFRRFFTRYLERTGDDELLGVCGLFYAFRGSVIANPAFYPEVDEERRRKIFLFVRNVLDDDRFDFDHVTRYLEG